MTSAKAEAPDLARLADLHAACFTMPRPWSQTEIASLLTSPFCFLLTRPQGFLMARCVAGEAELLTLAVDPAARRQGIGAALVDEFLQESHRRGAESAFLEVASQNQPAQLLYLSKGFVSAGVRKGYYHGPDGKPQDALMMVRSLQYL